MDTWNLRKGLIAIGRNDPSDMTVIMLASTPVNLE